MKQTSLLFLIAILISGSTLSCGVKSPPLPPLPTTPEQYEIVRPQPAPTPIPSPRPKGKANKTTKTQ